MAQNPIAYQPNDFGVGIAIESATGSVVANTTQLFTDSISMPSFAPDQDLSAKSGMFVADFAHVHSSQKNTPTEITVSGLLNDTVLDLLTGIFHTAHSTNVILVDDSYTAPLLFHNQTISGAAAKATFTVKVLAPQVLNDSGASPADNSIHLTGCSITALSISADAGSDGGRLKYSLTLKTGYAPVFTGAAGSTTAPVTTGFQTIHDMPHRTIAGVVDPVMQSFNLSIENPADYVGFDGANSRPSSISRSVPEGPVITLASTVKLDVNTKGYLANFMNNSAQTALVNHVSNDADQPAELTTSGGATGFGFSCDKAIITGMSFNEQAAMMYDIEQKLLFGSFRIRNT
ncbi:protein containing DUF11 [uncultured Mediterranean phage uvMED]|nr:protein containing DUF11 [uncultured Mediterranean phage uvMED]